MPPSTASDMPVVAPAAGLARYAMAAATSSAETRRPVGWRAASCAFSAAGSSARASKRATHGVSTVPGATQHTRTPVADQIGRHRQGQRVHGALRRGVERALDQTGVGGDRRQVHDDARGRCCRRYGRAARDARATPITLTSSTRVHSSSVGRHVADRADAGAVDEDVDAAERLGRGRHRGLQRGGVGDVGLDAATRAAPAGPPADSRSSTPTRAPAAASRRRRSPPDARAAAGDRRDQAVELTHQKSSPSNQFVVAASRVPAAKLGPVEHRTGLRPASTGSVKKRSGSVSRSSASPAGRLTRCCKRSRTRAERSTSGLPPVTAGPDPRRRRAVAAGSAWRRTGTRSSASSPLHSRISDRGAGRVQLAGVPAARSRRARVPRRRSTAGPSATKSRSCSTMS